MEITELKIIQIMKKAQNEKDSKLEKLDKSNQSPNGYDHLRMIISERYKAKVEILIELSKTLKE